MAKLKIAGLTEDKPVKLTLNCPQVFIAILSPMPKFWPGKAGKRSVTPVN
jgi:hypothetical protein